MKLAPRSIAVIGFLALVFGLVACGGEEDSTTTAPSASSSNGASAQEGAASEEKGASKGDDDDARATEKSGSEDSGSEAAEGDKKTAGPSGEKSPDEIARAEKREASKFVPKPHKDSGGGAKPLIVKGGDNSIQEFGREADDAERAAAAAALHNFLDSRAAGNWAAACSFLAAGVRESLEKFAAQAKQPQTEGCAGILEKLTNPAAMGLLGEEAAQADVSSLRVEGDRSFIIYRGLEGDILAMSMTNEGGSWKAASLAGTPLN